LTSLSELRFFATPPHPCSYLDDREAVTLFVDPAAHIDDRTYSALSAFGFRRSGNHIYRPHCQNCSACVPVRIPVDKFTMKRSQRRIWKRNRDLQVNEITPLFNAETYNLYDRYISQRHADGDMYPPEPEQFKSFLVESREETTFYEFREQESLVAVAVVDKLQDGLSSIYTFFDPDLAKQSPGVYTILWQIEKARELNLQYVYLGYWIKQSQKMNYKIEYKPLELFLKDHWILVS
jgi:arginyl-tRNA--protein-N-Asp/Glu arginylyltransferase